MMKVYKIDIVLPVYYGNIGIVEESTIKVVDYLRRIRGPYLFKIIISINGRRANDIIQIAEAICNK